MLTILSDKNAYQQVIGALMHNTLLFLEYPDIDPGADIDDKLARICFITIKNLYVQGATAVTPMELDSEILKNPASLSAKLYSTGDQGINFVKTCYEFADAGNFAIYYIRIKKWSLLRRLHKEHYDISDFCVVDEVNADPQKEIIAQENFNNASIEDILNNIEGKYNKIRNDYVQGGRTRGDPAEGLIELLDELRSTPNVGPELEGNIFTSACRGARMGCFYLKSASTSAGKTRTSVFDACHLAFPIRYSFTDGTFIQEYQSDYITPRAPRKVLFIVTEMDKTEIQTIMLAYLSGVNEEHILTARYEFGEYERVLYAAKIIQMYHEWFIIETISDPNLVNIEATIKKYATVDGVKYVFFDYIHSTASLFGQFARQNVREDVALMLMANQLKQLAKDYNVFIFSATQVNAGAMGEDGEFKNEMNIRGSKAVADKIDMGYVMTRVSDKMWQALLPNLKSAAREGIISANIFNDSRWRPTHVIDIYKMRRGRYKNIRIWLRLDLGTGERTDLFMTNADNIVETLPIDVFKTAITFPIDWEKEIEIERS